MHTRQTTLPQLCISPCFGEGAELSLATNAKVPQRDPISEAHYQIYNASVTQGQISAMQQYNLRWVDSWSCGGVFSTWISYVLLCMNDM